MVGISRSAQLAWLRLTIYALVNPANIIKILPMAIQRVNLWGCILLLCCTATLIFQNSGFRITYSEFAIRNPEFGIGPVTSSEWPGMHNLVGRNLFPPRKIYPPPPSSHSTRYSSHSSLTVIVITSATPSSLNEPTATASETTIRQREHQIKCPFARPNHWQCCCHYQYNNEHEPKFRRY